MDGAFVTAVCVVLCLWVVALVWFIHRGPPVVEGLVTSSSSFSPPIPSDIIASVGLSGKNIAIVTMMRDPKDVDEWLNYHLLKGVSHFYIRLETFDRNDKVANMLLTYPQVTLQIGQPTDTPPSTEGDLPGQAQMLRQRAWLAEAIRIAFKDGVDWMVHIDSDELLECKGTVADAILRDAKTDTQTMVIANVEAVYAKDKVDASEQQGCFTYNSVRDCSTGTCASYANGKSVGRVTPFLREAGVHRFGYVGPGHDNTVVMGSLRVLHFESCDFKQYMDKFLKLAHTEKLQFPFPYYNDSIAVAKGPACKQPTAPACKDEFANVYKRYRTA